MKVECIYGDYGEGKDKVQRWLDNNKDKKIKFITANQTGGLSLIWIFYEEKKQRGRRK